MACAISSLLASFRGDGGVLFNIFAYSCANLRSEVAGFTIQVSLEGRRPDTCKNSEAKGTRFCGKANASQV